MTGNQETGINRRKMLKMTSAAMVGASVMAVPASGAGTESESVSTDEVVFSEDDIADTEDCEIVGYDCIDYDGCPYNGLFAYLVCCDDGDCYWYSPDGECCQSV